MLVQDGMLPVLTVIPVISLHITRFIYQILEANWWLMLKLSLRTVVTVPAGEAVSDLACGAAHLGASSMWEAFFL